MDNDTSGHLNVTTFNIHIPNSNPCLILPIHLHGILTYTISMTAIYTSYLISPDMAVILPKEIKLSLIECLSMARQVSQYTLYQGPSILPDIP